MNTGDIIIPNLKGTRPVSGGLIEICSPGGRLKELRVVDDISGSTLTLRTLRWYEWFQQGAVKYIVRRIKQWARRIKRWLTN